MARVLVACVGGGLAGDCAAGSAVHALLSGCSLPDGSRLALVPAGPLRLLPALGGEECLVVVGEVELGARPGTVHLLDWREVPFGADGGARSGHDLRVSMEAARIRDPGRAPRRAYVVGIEGRGSGFAGGMHAKVAAALATAAGKALDLAHGLAGLDVSGPDLDAALPLAAGVRPPAPRATSTPPPPLGEAR